jgi:hypothetical protein
MNEHHLGVGAGRDRSSNHQQGRDTSQPQRLAVGPPHHSWPVAHRSKDATESQATAAREAEHKSAVHAALDGDGYRDWGEVEDHRQHAEVENQGVRRQSEASASEHTTHDGTRDRHGGADSARQSAASSSWQGKARNRVEGRQQQPFGDREGILPHELDALTEEWLQAQAAQHTTRLASPPDSGIREKGKGRMAWQDEQMDLKQEFREVMSKMSRSRSSTHVLPSQPQQPSHVDSLDQFEGSPPAGHPAPATHAAAHGYKAYDESTSHHVISGEQAVQAPASQRNDHDSLSPAHTKASPQARKSIQRSSTERATHVPAAAAAAHHDTAPQDWAKEAFETLYETIVSVVDPHESNWKPRLRQALSEYVGRTGMAARGFSAAHANAWVLERYEEDMTSLRAELSAITHRHAALLTSLARQVRHASASAIRFALWPPRA